MNDTVTTSPETRRAAAYGLEALRFDEEAEAKRIGDAIRRYLVANKRKGIVLGVSGGIDSSVVAALAVKA
ncbi:MAG: NAD(+) synthase, partial [Streptomyces sp.]|nr:NAD(+) synthase [Streptomyces sp.]